MSSSARFLATGLLALAVLVLLTAAALADAQLATSVIGSAGGTSGSANFIVKGTLGQSTPIGPSSSVNFRVGAGYWYQDPVPPSVIGDLMATLSAGDIALEWSPAADNVAIDHYVVYRGTDPVFVPASGNSIHETKGTAYLDPGAAGTVGTNYFYLVKAEDPSANKAGDSNRVGEFDADMVNGTK